MSPRDDRVRSSWARTEPALPTEVPSIPRGVAAKGVCWYCGEPIEPGRKFYTLRMAHKTAYAHPVCDVTHRD